MTMANDKVDDDDNCQLSSTTKPPTHPPLTHHSDLAEWGQGGHPLFCFLCLINASMLMVEEIVVV